MRLPWVSRDRFEEALRKAQTLQDDLRHSKAETLAAREALAVAERDARLGREMVCDWLAERQFGKPIFGVPIPKLPPDPLEQEAFTSLGNRGRSGRDIAQQMTQQFLEQFDARQKA